MSQSMADRLEPTPKELHAPGARHESPDSHRGSSQKLANDPSIAHALEPLGISEKDFGDFMFDYLAAVDSRLKESFCYNLAQLKHAMSGFLTQHFCKVVKKGQTEIVGLLCYGLQTQTQITVFHLTVKERPKFRDTLKDVIALLFQRHCTVAKVSIALRYTSGEAGAEKNAGKTIDPQLKSDLVDFGFKTKSVHVDIAKRKTAFLAYQIESAVQKKDPRAENIKFSLRLFLARLKPEETGLQKPKRPSEEASPFLSVDVRSALLVALSGYTNLFGKWKQTADFSKPLHSITLEDLAAAKDAIEKSDPQMIRNEPQPSKKVCCVSSKTLEQKAHLSRSELAVLAGPSAARPGPGEGDPLWNDFSHLVLTSQLAVGIRYCEHSSIQVKFNTDSQPTTRSYLHIRKVALRNPEPRDVQPDSQEALQRAVHRAHGRPRSQHFRDPRLQNIQRSQQTEAEEAALPDRHRALRRSPGSPRTSKPRSSPWRKTSGCPASSPREPASRWPRSRRPSPTAT